MRARAVSRLSAAAAADVRPVRAVGALRRAAVAARWRWRRFVVRRRALLVAGVLAGIALGPVVSPRLHDWSRGTVLAGRDRVRGQVIARPALPRRAVRGASVRLVPLAPVGLAAAAVSRLGAPAPPALRVGTDFAGRWTVPSGLATGWSYAVLVDALDCPLVLAATVDVGRVSASRVDLVMRRCARPLRGPGPASRPLPPP